MKYSVIQKLKSKYNLVKLLKSNQNRDSKTIDLWYKEKFTRQQADNYLQLKEIGVFIVRKSETNKNCHVLSVRVPKYINAAEISHYLILRSKNGYCIKGLDKHFDNLKSLITHCSIMRDMIPILLNLKYYNQLAGVDEYNKNKNNFMYYFTSTTSLGSTISSTSDFSEDFELDLSTSSSINLFN